MRVYLDNCCYNRPYDDQSYLRISLEAQAKLMIQSEIREKHIELSSSYILMYENDKNPYDIRKKAIRNFVKQNVSVYINGENFADVEKIAEDIIKTGIKTADACHIAAAILSQSDYFITTDDRVLKYTSDKITVTDPISFIKILEVQL